MTLEERIAEAIYLAPGVPDASWQRLLASCDELPDGLAREIVVQARDDCRQAARAVVAVLPTADVNRIGERVQDGGEWGTIVRCHECDGQGVLHRLDVQPTPVEPTGGTA